MAVQLANRSVCHATPDSPMARSTSLARPVLSAKMLPKMSAAAAGATTNGSSTLIRHQVRPRNGVSSMAATTVATTTCGTADSTKMPMVFQKALWNTGSVSTWP